MSTLKHYDDLVIDDNSGTITFELPDSLKKTVTAGFTYELESDVVNIGNFPWRMKIEHTMRPNTHEVFVSLCCNEKCKNALWSCEATTEYRMIRERVNGAREVHSMIKLEPLRYNYVNTRSGCQGIFHLSELCKENAISLTIEAHVTVKNIVGVRKRKIFEFDSSLPNLSNVSLIVQGIQIFVNKTFLGMYSPFFYAMFFSDFNEKSKTEIVLKDVEYEDFKELLSIIYPTQNDIRENTYEKMLELADRYQIESVIDKCEKFLISDSKIDSSKKLLVAQKYKLSKLMNACIQKCVTMTDMRKMSNQKFYKELNYDTRAALLERIFKLNE